MDDFSMQTSIYPPFSVTDETTALLARDWFTERGLEDLGRDFVVKSLQLPWFLLGRNLSISKTISYLNTGWIHYSLVRCPSYFGFYCTRSKTGQMSGAIYRSTITRHLDGYRRIHRTVVRPWYIGGIHPT